MSETPIIYREYLLKHFPTTVKTEYNPVDFIIGFASENYTPTGGGTGYFQPTWNLDTFSPEKVKELKEIYPHVRWVISIRGVGTDYPFNPIDKFAWVVTAVKSIKEIIQIYDDDNHKNLIDGIEIHYEAIKGSDVDFSSCIGHVIIFLKEDPDLSIKVVSISPTEDTQSYYQTLYHGSPKSIDFVDYLFTNHTFSSDEDVVKLYKKLVADYKHAPVLPGFLNPPFPDDRLKQAIIRLVENKLAPGYFTYPSRDSRDPGPAFLEEDASKHIE